jgi:NAD(P)-dependent dehydrogenase (short-subunit alcohol dehydrogenase family)
MKKVLITGACGTVGRALCAGLEGYELLLHDYKGRAAFGGDFSKPDEVEKLIQEVKKLGPLYAIVNTVGNFVADDKGDVATWQELFQNNVISAAQLAYGLKPEVFITFGIEGLEKPAVKMVAYLACKNALASLTKSLTWMRATMICPGVIEGSKHILKGPQVPARAIVDVVRELLD